MEKNADRFDLIVRHGTLVIPGVGRVAADVGIAGGKIVALDTPAALKRDLVPGTMLRVEGAQLSRALPALRARDGVIGAQGFGTGLHVRVDGRASTDDVRAILADAGAAVTSIEAITPTLEDVFLAAADAAVESQIRGGAAS